MSSDTLMGPTRFLEIPVTKLPTEAPQNPRVAKNSWTPWRMPQISQATASPTVRGNGTCRHRYMKPPPELTWTTVTRFSRSVAGFSWDIPGSAHRAVHGWHRFLLRLLRSYNVNYHSINVPHSLEMSHSLLKHWYTEFVGKINCIISKILCTHCIWPTDLYAQVGKPACPSDVMLRLQAGRPRNFGSTSGRD